ncbi:5-guanidino-2-oxopentanoate decarboxylase [Labrys wisconsinensis]|uniref:Acetolactate synthase-1/2/3 large subunit n=1 Tax=Labrys wisconsinensis TaxID=425677 RepID=A0ABU0IZ81_9HYPH|nr:5-guanidino-2-oxopentanoate decarboxylase [Labrys wisconsinensis]MDQ0467313.1 acetolactate synthase-1/2/3 large subunit [Labrys wisconsinensis]
MTDLPPLGSAIPALLAARGIDTVFGIPGVHTVELYRGLPGSGLRHVTPRHEQGAGFMADGFARATGRPAACFIVTGPGLLNIATAMGQAMADSVPMLVFATLNPRATLGRGEGRLHELRGQSAVGREVAVLALTVLTASQLVPALDEAFAVFASARPGPVLIELPIDLLSEPYALPSAAPASPARPGLPDPDAVAAAAARLNAARRPLVIVGGGAISGADAVRAMAERLGAPVLLTANAKGILPPGHPLLGGGCVLTPALHRLVGEADVVLALGTELGETDFWYEEGGLELQGDVIRVDIDPRQLARNARPALPVLADAGRFARALTPLLAPLASDGPARAQALRAALMDGADPRYTRHRPLLDALWRVLPEAIVAADSTSASYGGNFLAEPPAPRRWMSAATGFGTLGYALPAAIGAKAARPEAPVVCIIGDGGLQYTLPEFAAATESGLPVIVLLWNDRRYGEIENYMIRRQIAPLGVELHPTDFSLIARAFGCEHVAADSLAEVEAALRAAAVGPVSTVIEMDASRFAS